MKRHKRIGVLILFLITLFNIKAFAYNPEILVGNRSIFYQHAISTSLHSKFKFNNITQFDNEYFNNRNNIYFIRNSISYPIFKNFSINAALGLKNPGSFSTLFINYNLSKNNFILNYSIGFTLQKKYSYEQMFIIEKNIPINKNIAIHTKFQALTNITQTEYLRGFQHFRIGLKHHSFNYGLASNFDQFNNNKRTLQNYGIYIKKII